jgi:nitrate reductase gamma subunit
VSASEVQVFLLAGAVVGTLTLAGYLWARRVSAGRASADSAPSDRLTLAVYGTTGLLLIAAIALIAVLISRAGPH